MKSLIALVLIALMYCPVYAQSNTATIKDTAKYLNDICGDTWCEGEYDWHFEATNKGTILIRQFGQTGKLRAKREVFLPITDNQSQYILINSIITEMEK